MGDLMKTFELGMKLGQKGEATDADVVAAVQVGVTLFDGMQRGIIAEAALTGEWLPIKWIWRHSEEMYVLFEVFSSRHSIEETKSRTIPDGEHIERVGVVKIERRDL